MSDPNLMSYAGLVAVGTGIGISGRIVFDWLKNRNGNQSKETDIHSALSSSECFKWKTGVETSLATQGNTLINHEKRLDKGSQDFEGIKKSIAGIDISMAVFAEKLEKE